jgi:hypothetical protein
MYELVNLELLANFNDKITIKWNDYMIHITYDDLLTLSLEDEVDNITRCWLNDKVYGNAMKYVQRYYCNFY